MSTTTFDILSDKDLDRVHSRQYADDFREWLKAPGPATASRLVGVNTERQQAVRALGSNAPAAGGYLAPEGFSKQIWSALSASSVMRALATVSQSVGVDSGFPFVDDTGNRGTIVPENTSASETDLVVGLKKIPSFAFDSDLLRVSLQLLQDAGEGAIEAFLTEKLSERIARNLNYTCTVGNGAAMPQGVATAAPVGVTGSAGTVSTVTWASLTALVASVGTAYVYGPDGQKNIGRWMLNRSSLQEIRDNVRDPGGNAAWTQDPTGQSAGLILGHRVVVNDDVATMAASAKSILFGDFGGYIIRDGVVLVQSLNERFIEYGQVGFRVMSRHGGQLVDTAAVRAYQNAAS